MQYPQAANLHEVFFILCIMPCDAKTVLEMVDCFFNIYSDFICATPFLRAAGSSGIGSEILFWIDIEHTPAGRFCAWRFTFTNTFGFFSGFIVFPLHLRTAGNTIFVKRTVRILKRDSPMQRDKRFLKRCCLQKIFVNLNGVKSCIIQKNLRINPWMFFEKIR